MAPIQAPLSVQHPTPLYFMTPMDNLASILMAGLLPLNRLLRDKIEHRSIADEDVQALRSRIYVVNGSRRLNLHDFVPLYFVTRTPMLYRRRDLQDGIAYIEVISTVLDLPGAVLSDGNASRQGLHETGSGTVDVFVAHGKTDACSRQYQPRWSRATGRAMSNLFTGPAALGRLPWDGIRAPSWAGNDEVKRQKQAEALVPHEIHPHYFARVHVRTRAALVRARCAVAAAGRVTPVCLSPQLYFADGPAWHASPPDILSPSAPGADQAFEAAAWDAALAWAAEFDGDPDYPF